jgi:hypothetical protein
MPHGSSFALLRKQIIDAIAAGEFQPLDVEVSAMALYGAVRSAGEFVIDASDRATAVKAVIRTLDCFIEGMRAVS